MCRTVLHRAVPRPAGQLLNKALRGGRLPASFEGVHVEVVGGDLPADASASSASASGPAAQPPHSPTPAYNRGASFSAGGAAGSHAVGAAVGSELSVLAAALPLRPGASVSIPLELHVGQAPRDAFRDMRIEVSRRGERAGARAPAQTEQSFDSAVQMPYLPTSMAEFLFCRSASRTFAAHLAKLLTQLLTRPLPLAPAAVETQEPAMPAARRRRRRRQWRARWWGERWPCRCRLTSSPRCT